MVHLDPHTVLCIRSWKNPIIFDLCLKELYSGTYNKTLTFGDIREICTLIWACSVRQKRFEFANYLCIGVTVHSTLRPDSGLFSFPTKLYLGLHWNATVFSWPKSERKRLPLDGTPGSSHGAVYQIIKKPNYIWLVLKRTLLRDIQQDSNLRRH